LLRAELVLMVAAGVGRPTLDKEAVRCHQVAATVEFQRAGLSIDGLLVGIGYEEPLP